MIIILDSVPKVVYMAFYGVVFRVGCTEKVTSGLFKTCSMMIFLYHFNTFLSVFLRQNMRYFMQEYCVFIQFDRCIFMQKFV